VGEGPGQTEVQTGHPFVGASGRLLNRALGNIDPNERERVWVTNATLCIPPQNATDAHKRAARECCAPRLDHELAQFPGKPVLALGAVAAQGFLGDKFSITEMAGALHTLADGREVIPTIHPAAILRGGGGATAGAHAVDLLFWNLVYDAAKVKRLAAGAEVKFSDDITTEVEDSHRAESLVEGFLWHARKVREIAVDVETAPRYPGSTALVSHWARLTAIGLATTEWGLSVAWEILPPRARAFVKALLGDASIIKGFHNSLYDKPVLLHNGMPVRGPIFDTLLLHHAAFPGLAHDLQRVATQFFAISPWKAEFRGGRGSLEELARYNCLMAGTPVVLADGTTRSIETIVRREQPVEVLALGSGGIRTRRVTGWHRARVRGQSWLQVRTMADGAAHGRGLVVTPEHEIYTARGPVRADELRYTDTIALPEIAWSAEQHAAVLGTLLGDSVLSTMPSYRDRPASAPTLALHGSHTLLSGLTAYKVAALAPHARSGATCKAASVTIQGRVAQRKASQLFHTRELHQLQEFRRWLVDDAGRRRLWPETLARLGAVGLAWWFMDDGCRQNNKDAQRDTVCLALCRYSMDDAQAALAWFREHYGRGLWMGRDRVLRFGPEATAAFCAEIDAHVLPSVRYKLPRLWQPTEFRPLLPGEPRPVYAALRSVEAYLPAAHDKMARLRAETRFCLTVEDDHNFFTSFGLVANCRDALATARLRPVIEICVKRTRTEKAYECDLKMAEIAERMHVVGVPVSRQINGELHARFESEITRAQALVEERAGDPAIQEKFYDRLAFEQAKRIRKADSAEFIERHRARLQELRDGAVKFNIDSAEHLAAYLKARGAPLHQETEKGKLSTKRDILEGLAHIPEVREILIYRENTKMLSTFCEALPGYMDRDDRIHPVWNVHRITGRWSAERPVIQNISKGDSRKGRPNLRTQFVAPEGRVFVGADMAQLEARGIAVLSGDSFLVDIFKHPPDKYGPGDIHAQFARVVWPDFDSMEKKPKAELRDMVKRPEYCLVPGTRVLTLDLKWVPIEQLHPGDGLLGFVAAPLGTSWRETYFAPSTVQGVRSLQQPCYRITTTEGVVTASDEHLWVGWRGGAFPSGRRHGSKTWLRTDQLRSGDTLIFTARPWNEDLSWGGGYLAGVFDGEGWAAHRRVGFAQNPGLVLNLTRQLLSERGFSLMRYDARRRGERCVKAELEGGLWECLHFLGSIRPRRLLARSSATWAGRRLRGRGPGARVLSVEFVGTQDVVALGTSTETFIAEGFLSHNCTFYGGAAETAWTNLVKDYPSVKLADIQRMVSLMNARCVRVNEWHEELLRRVATTGELRSAIFNRRRCWPLGNAEATAVYNWSVQALGADVMNRGLWRLAPRLPKGAEIILQIHDAVVVECDEDQAEHVRDLVNESLTQEVTVDGVTVSFPAEADIGKDWASV
jgi:uracil-DNA glycosylase family 4